MGRAGRPDPGPDRPAAPDRSRDEPSTRLWRSETSQFILVTEQENHLRSPGYDHLGILYETREEVDALLEKTRKWQERDARVQIKEYEDLVMGPVTTHAFYVKHLLPIWLDVQCQEFEDGSAPARSWQFA